MEEARFAKAQGRSDPLAQATTQDAPSHFRLNVFTFTGSSSRNHPSSLPHLLSRTFHLLMRMNGRHRMH